MTVGVLSRRELETLDDEELLFLKAVYGRKIQDAQNSGDSAYVERAKRAVHQIKEIRAAAVPEREARDRAVGELWRAARDLIDDDNDDNWAALEDAFSRCPVPHRERIDR